ncbi:MAG: hypothetical protein JWO58_3352 [Chitinophagaceae bacterium]|nr:hypothetical protein [Chitinophagaceae bacterium]
MELFTSESVPKALPELGFYYHNKRPADATVESHAYELVGVGYHSETGELTALYRPLYEEAFAYQNGRLIYSRPLEMFMETVPKGENGTDIPRFKNIDDEALISRLKTIRDEMYPKTEGD